MVQYSTPLKLKPRQLRFLRLMYPAGSVCVGLDVGQHMLARGYLILGRNGRYTLSPAGRAAIEAADKRRGALPKCASMPASPNEVAS